VTSADPGLKSLLFWSTCTPSAEITLSLIPDVIVSFTIYVSVGSIHGDLGTRFLAVLLGRFPIAAL
jgi:hypothetical protein